MDVSTLQNPDSVESNLIKVRLNTKVVNGKIVSEKVPNAQYILTNNKVIIPKDVTYGQLFGLYKIMEDLYSLDKTSGISNHLSYPGTVSL